jgi:DNA mismatch repair ATPase MutS
LADAHDHTHKKSKDSEAMAAQHQARLDEMMNIKQQHETEIDELRETVRNATRSLEGKEEVSSPFPLLS